MQSVQSAWFVAVGFKFRNSKSQDLKSAYQILLKLEPSNAYDPNAIQVIIKNQDNSEKHVAYVTKDETERIKPFLQDQNEYNIILLDVWKNSAQLVINKKTQSVQ